MLVLPGWLPKDIQCCNPLFITKPRSTPVTFYNSYRAVQSSYNCPNLVFSKPEEVRKEKKEHIMDPLQLASLADLIIKQGFSCISCRFSKSLSISAQQERSDWNSIYFSWVFKIIITLDSWGSFWCGFELQVVGFLLFGFFYHHKVRILSYVQWAIKKLKLQKYRFLHSSAWKHLPWGITVSPSQYAFIFQNKTFPKANLITSNVL